MKAFTYKLGVSIQNCNTRALKPSVELVLLTGWVSYVIAEGVKDIDTSIYPLLDLGGGDCRLT